MEASENHVRIDLDHSIDRSHDVVFGEIGSLPELLAGRVSGPRSCLVVTDRNLARHYGSRLDDVLTTGGWTSRSIVIEAGEGSKSMASYSRIVDEALSGQIDRQTLVIAFGGGVVGDLAGFLAATLLRGLPFVQIPTSLVAQVDSAIGGKTGINHGSGKNLIGSFHQPRLVLVDAALLRTLPEGEWLDGLSEVVKYGLIADAAFAQNLLANWKGVVARNVDVVRSMVRRCVEIKADIVSRDETEQGVRAILNFGHTFGHALERVAGYQGVTHGQGVSVGMRAAIHLSRLRYPGGDLSDADRLVALLPTLGIMVRLDDLIAAMSTDKKRLDGRIRFVLLRAIGEAVVEAAVSESQIREAWERALGPFDS